MMANWQWHVWSLVWLYQCTFTCKIDKYNETKQVENIPLDLHVYHVPRCKRLYSDELSWVKILPMEEHR
jgi:hypothetical protein